MAKNQLLISTFWTFYPQESASRRGNQLFPFTQAFALLLYDKLSKPYAFSMPHVAANLALKL